MKIITSNIIKPTPDVDAICIPTNGITKNNGCAVMGAGLAKVFLNHYPGIDKILGNKLNHHGNHVFILLEEETPAVVSFPTKQDWKDKSDLNLIQHSAEELYTITDLMDWNKVWLPVVGCGLGGLVWESQVKPLLESILDDDRFEIVFLPN